MKKINKYLIFSFIVALVALLITSKNSFLYVFNDWVDANAFFTVGKSWFNGVLPYKELFEQKGPLLYLIYGLGYIISPKNFHGVFILEVLSFTIFLYYLHKTFNIYFDKKYSLFLLPIIAFLITTNNSFVHGGSCEEFTFPLIAISLYYYFKHFKKKELTKREIFINGLMAGLVLTMKYTILGFWIGFCLFIVLNYLRKKELKKIIIFCIFFLLGMIIPFLVAALYFLINNGFKEFIDVYFKINMTSYPTGNNYNIIMKFFLIMVCSLPTLEKLISTLVLIHFPIFLSKEKNKRFLFSFAGLIYITTFFIYYGLKSYPYYDLPIVLLIIITDILCLLLIIKKYIDKIIHKKYIIIIMSILYMSFPFFTYKYANYSEYITMKKEDFVQYKYAKYINEYEDATLLNCGGLDFGVYTLTGIIPNTRFFEVQNFEYKDFKDNLDEIEKYIKNKEVRFIVYSNLLDNKTLPKYIYDNYEQVYKDNYVFEGEKFTSYLFKLKE